MVDQPSGHAREVRDTIVKSSLTGVAGTVLAVTAFSPAGFGGMLGTSMASGLGADSDSANSYVNLPPFVAPLSEQELADIRGQLATVSSSLTMTRAATDASIDRMRILAAADGVFPSAVAPVASQQFAREETGLRLTPSEPIQEAALSEPELATLTPVAFPTVDCVGEAAEADSYRDRHLELAALILGQDTF
ncbi:MAG: hypothetical protein R3C25_12895 [Hyphomonadaceae bacterium]